MIDTIRTCSQKALYQLKYCSYLFSYLFFENIGGGSQDASYSGGGTLARSCQARHVGEQVPGFLEGVSTFC